MTPQEQAVIAAAQDWYAYGENEHENALVDAVKTLVSTPLTPSITIWRFADAPQEYRDEYPTPEDAQYLVFVPSGMAWDDGLFSDANDMCIVEKDQGTIIIIEYCND